MESIFQVFSIFLRFFHFSTPCYFIYPGACFLYTLFENFLQKTGTLTKNRYFLTNFVIFVKKRQIYKKQVFFKPAQKRQGERCILINTYRSGLRTTKLRNWTLGGHLEKKIVKRCIFCHFFEKFQTFFPKFTYGHDFFSNM